LSSPSSVHRGLHAAFLIQRRFQVELVEFHAESGQVQILFVTLIRHGKNADRVDIVDIALRRDRSGVGGRDRRTRQIVACNIRDVLAVVRILGPARVAGSETPGARLRR
jgi:hypothetical protein